MDVQQLGGANSPQYKPNSTAQTTPKKPERSTLEQQADELTLSPEALNLGETMSETNPTHTEDRQARIARIQAEIAAGTYDTPERLEAAMLKFLSSTSLDD